jgi:hypothetical protein
MSALGHKRTLRRIRPMSALPPKADMAQHARNARSGLIQCNKKDPYSITSSAETSSVFGTAKPRAVAVFLLISSTNLTGC